jgi:hypothetical protein
MESIVSTASKTSKRHFRRIMSLLLVVIVVIVVANNLTFYLIRAPKNVGMAQMIYGWARLYKPMIYDDVKPDAVSFGYSWVRDIFDPVKAEGLTGERFFNFGISGATSFESFRLVQNALAVHVPKRVFLDMESFRDAPRASMVEHQFDERILYVKRDGSPNPTAKLNRIIKINTSGAALAFNYRFLKTLWAANNGTPLEDLLPSYERRDWRKMPGTIADMKRWMAEGDDPKRQIGGPGGRFLGTFNDLEASVGLLCDANVEINVYEAPYICGSGGKDTKAVLALLRKKAQSCKSKITYNTFRYPNAASMEGVFATPGLSTFYRPDGHPRPPLGQMILTRILKLENTAGAPTLPRDFGGDLMAMTPSEAEAWIDKRAARCRGQWLEGEYQQIEADAAKLIPEWQAKFIAQ